MNVTSDASLAQLAARLGERLAAYGRRITTAESCTGGWIGKVLTDVSGSSRWFETGYIVYGNGAKTALLGVAPALLVEHGAVSEPVVRAMALAALERSGADLAVAVSGIAGPDGGSPAKPVGTVWLGWAVRHGTAVQVQTRCEKFDGNREAVRRATVHAALGGALAL
jgi:nicotinamide-nucleotide amidase